MRLLKKIQVWLTVVTLTVIWGIFWNLTMAATTNTNTSLWITAGTLSFIKDVSSNMNSYFSWSPNASTSIDIGSYSANINAISAASDDDHRFTISDMLGDSFTVTIQSSAMTATEGTIPASNVWYTGTNRLGTGAALTASPTSAVDIGTAPVTFVARSNSNGLSLFSQEITLTVSVPGAQIPGSYTGLITFTY
jgi:hypothetical protein